MIAQSFKIWEIIIVDDGSTDNSCIIIENYVKNNRNIKLIKQKNKGIAISRNIAVKNSLFSVIRLRHQKPSAEA